MIGHKVFHAYFDPGHGWVKTPISLLKSLNIDKSISFCSYKRNGFAYLEEDDDYGKLARALRVIGIEPVIRCHYADKSSKIRSYDHYDAREV